MRTLGEWLSSKARKQGGTDHVHDRRRSRPSALPGDPAPPPLVPAYGDHRTVFRGVSWETYQSLSRAQGEGDHVRLAYDGKDLEIMTTGYVHEVLKELVGLIIKAVVSWRGIAHVGSGEATLDAVDAKRGLQADLSYCFDPEKVRTAREAVARGSTDPADYPRPDLAVEIDISPSQVDRPSIYAALKVSEVWRIKRDRKRHHRASPAGRLVCPRRGEPVPGHHRRGGPRLADRGGCGSGRGLVLPAE